MHDLGLVAVQALGCGCLWFRKSTGLAADCEMKYNSGSNCSIKETGGT